MADFLPVRLSISLPQPLQTIWPREGAHREGPLAEHARMIEKDGKLPPYGKELAKRRLSGVPINLYICAGAKGWKFAEARIRNRADALVLPPGEDPQKYHWPVRGLDVLLCWPDGNYAGICRFAEILIRQGATKVIAPWAEDKDGYLSFYPLRREIA